MNGWRPLRRAAAGLALLLALAPRAAGARAAEGPMFATQSPRFAADLTTALDSTGTPSISVSVEVPYTECQFVRVSAGFGAGLEFLVVLRDRGGRPAGGDDWEERFALSSFEESRDNAARVRASRTFHVRPGKYRVKVHVRDLNSGQESGAEQDIELAGLGRESLALSDLAFGECVPESSAATVFVGNASRRYAADLERFCVRGNIVDLRPGAADRRYALHYRVYEERGDEVLRGDTLVAAAAARPFTLHPPIGGLFLGSYSLEVTVDEGGRSWKTRGDFEVEAVTVPQGRQWAVFLEILEYVAPPADLEPLQKAKTPEERERRWREFWARHDPSPESPRNETLLEFMERVRYANAQFSTLGPGWRTDQGRIYIQHGAPDQVEDLPATTSHPPLQIWHYLTINRRYVFADRDGFGRYELVSETAG